MKFQYNDGGRAKAGFKGRAGDCVTRAVAIASGKSYSEVYAMLSRGMGDQRKSQGATARNGVNTSRKWFKNYMASLGFQWVPCMTIGSGCKVHLADGELPMGRIVARVSKHLCAVIDGTIQDTYNPSDRATTIFPLHTPSQEMPKNVRLLENGNGWEYSPQRCVYGYWILHP